MKNTFNPITPGEYLQHEFLEPLGISQSQISRDIDVPVSRIHGILTGARAITADTAMRFAEYFKTSPQMWLNLQSQYELRVLQRESWPDIQPRIRPYSSPNEYQPSA